ncbi:MAG TPA: hypothetical protein VD713_03495, partial [Sphingomonadales bacterium]|nr:hypothetical protein [Sphingomonadales bacterium]
MDNIRMKGIGDFPELRGGPPAAWGLTALGLGAGALILFPLGWTLLLGTGAILAVLLGNVVAGRGTLRKSDSSIILGAVVLLLIALYGAFREYGRLDPWAHYGLIAAAAGTLYAARRLWAFRFARRAALAFAGSLPTD